MVTREDIDDLVSKMAAERSTLLAVCEQVGEERAEVRPPDGEGEDGWSVKEQLSHLAQMEVMYRAWVRRAVHEERPDVSQGTAYEPVAYPLEQAHEASVSEHVAELRRQRETTLTFIEGLTPEQYERTASQSNFGELTVLQWLRSYYRHDRMHGAQIQGRQSDYRPRFLNGEPDQRQRRT